MCLGPELMMIASVGNTMIKAGAQAEAGKEKQRQSDAKARQVELDAQMASVESKQKSRAMFEQYVQDSNANEAWFSYLGTEGSESIKAFKERQKELIGEQELRRRTQDTLQATKSKVEANTLKASGRASLAAGQIGAVSTLLTGGISIYENFN